jgi:hypothetical protein
MGNMNMQSLQMLPRKYVPCPVNHVNAATKAPTCTRVCHSALLDHHHSTPTSET